MKEVALEGRGDFGVLLLKVLIFHGPRFVILINYQILISE
jgi:hypothetical protein